MVKHLKAKTISKPTSAQPKAPFLLEDVLEDDAGRHYLLRVSPYSDPRFPMIKAGARIFDSDSKGNILNYNPKVEIYFLDYPSADVARTVLISDWEPKYKLKMKLSDL